MVPEWKETVDKWGEVGYWLEDFLEEEVRPPRGARPVHLIITTIKWVRTSRWATGSRTSWRRRSSPNLRTTTSQK